MEIGKAERDKWPSSSSFSWGGEGGRCLGLFLPLPLLHPSAELSFPGFACVSEDRAREVPTRRAGEKLSASNQETASQATGKRGEKGGKRLEEAAPPSPGNASPA